MTERVLSPEALQEMLAENSGAVAAYALKIMHADLQDDLRLIANTEDITFETELYKSLLFSASLPEDSEDEVPTVRISIDNVSGEIVKTVRSISSPPMMELSVLLIFPDGTIKRESGPANFRMTRADWDALICEAHLGYEADYLNEPAQAHRYDPTTHPGLFT